MVNIKKVKIVNLIVVIVLIFGGFGVLPFMFDFNVEQSSVNAATTRYVYPGASGLNNYTTIQAAIDNASAGDTIMIWAGNYTENVLVNKTLTIIGNSTTNTTIDGGGSGDVMQITAGLVNISGLTMNNSGSLIGDAGIKIDNSDRCRIESCNLSNISNGIYLERSWFNTIKNNNCTNNTYSGIYVTDGSSNNSIENNNCSGNNDGLQLIDASNNTISGNDVINNSDDGIELSSSTNNIINNNTISNNSDDGIDLDSNSDNNKILNNTISSNLYGTFLTDADNNIVFNNTYTNNINSSIGLYSFSTNNNISNNSCSGSLICISSFLANGNIFKNNTLWLNQIGFGFSQSHNNSLTNNTISFSTFNGIYLENSDNNSISNNTLNNNPVGINLTSGTDNCQIINTSIINSVVFSLFLNGSSNALTLNCTLDLSKVHYHDNTSSLTVQWYMHINVTNGTGASVSGANVVVEDNSSSVIFTGQTDDYGWSKWVICTEYIENITGKTPILTPHNVTVSKVGFEDAYTDPKPTMNMTKIVYVILYNDIIPPNPPTNLTFSAIGGTYLNFSWDPSNSSDVQGYKIYINDTGSSSSFHWLGNSTNTYFNATNLIENTTYYFNITAFDEVPLESTPLQGNNITDELIPETPTDLVFTEIGSTYLNISWNASTSTDILGYYIYINDTGSTTSFHLLNTTSSTFYNVTDLVDDTIYYFNITAYDIVPYESAPLTGNSKTSDITPPNPPTNLTFSAIGGTYLNFTWDASNSSDVQGYKIYINDTGSSSSFHWLGNSTNTYFNATNLIENITYYFNITAFDEAHLESTPLQGNNITDELIPETPTDIVFTVIGSTYLNISWNASTSTDVLGYYIYINDTGSTTSFRLLDSTTNTYYNVTGLVNDTVYYFNITAYDIVPYESAPLTGYKTTIDLTPPEPPTNLVFDLNGGIYLNFSWTASTSYDIMGYHVFINDTLSSDSFHPLGTTQNTYFNVTGLLEETKYYFVVIAFDDVPFNATNLTGNITTADITAPNTPTNLQLDGIGGTFAEISWSASTSADVSGYDIFINNTGSASSYHYLASTASTNYNATGLVQELTYYFQVRAYDEVPVYSAFTLSIQAVTLDITTPGAPTSLETIDVSGRTLTLSWAAPADTDIAGYQAYVNDTGADATGPFHLVQNIQSTSTSYPVSGLMEETTYYFVIKAFDEVPNYSIYSNVASATTLDITKPAKPTGFYTDAVYPRAVELKWDLNTEADVAGYKLLVNNTDKGSNGPFHEVVSLGNTISNEIVSGLAEETTYHFILIAFDEVPNYSPNSDVVTITTPDGTTPQPPTNVKITKRAITALTLTWESSIDDDVEGYNVYRSESESGVFVKINDNFIGGTTYKYKDDDLVENTTYHYKITAYDEVPNESEFSESVSGMTRLGPHPPELRNPPLEITLIEDTPDDSSIKLYNWFYDINGDISRFKCIGQKHIAVEIFSGNGTVILRPEKNWNGFEYLNFTAEDGLFDVSHKIKVTVTAVNDPPDVPKITKPKDIKIKDGESLDFAAECTDPDIDYGDELTITWTSNLSGEIGDESSLTDIILPLGMHLITIECEDRSGMASNATMKITVSETEESDSDDDGMPNMWERDNGLDPNDATDKDGDPDGDLLSNLHEFQNKTDPQLSDTDNDGLSDLKEIEKYKTNPTKRDTDGDGHIDGKDAYPLDSEKWEKSTSAADNTMLIMAAVIIIIIIIILIFAFVLKRRKGGKDKGEAKEGMEGEGIIGFEGGGEGEGELPPEQPMYPPFQQFPQSPMFPPQWPPQQFPPMGGPGQGPQTQTLPQQPPTPPGGYPQESPVQEQDSTVQTELEDLQKELMKGEEKPEDQIPKPEDEPKPKDDEPESKPEQADPDLDVKIKDMVIEGAQAFGEERYTDAIIAWQQVLEIEPDEHSDIKDAIKDAMNKMKEADAPATNE